MNGAGTAQIALVVHRTNENNFAVTELDAIQTFALPIAVGLVAFLYSSVGHGGATGYLAAAALLGMSPALARPGALWMNCVAAGIIGAVLGTHFGVNRWRTEGFRRALAVVLWIAAAKLFLTGK